jgi:hypothetical protein
MNMKNLLCLVLLGSAFLKSNVLANTSTQSRSDAAEPKSIPWSEIGAKAGADYEGGGLAVTATGDGARLRCVFQRIDGEATLDGLWLNSTVINQPSDQFRVKADLIGGLELPEQGQVSVEDQTVRFARPGLVEEYSVSIDGVRQDFIVLTRPVNSQTSTVNFPDELRLVLSVAGARVERTYFGAQLVLHKSGRKIAYSRLHVTDATGRELAANIEVRLTRKGGHDGGSGTGCLVELLFEVHR